MVAAPGPLARLAGSLAEHGLDAVLLSTPPAVTYASGFEVPLPGAYTTEVTGWLPPLALVTADARGALLVCEDDLPAARASSWLEIEPFHGLRHFQPSLPAETWRDGLEAALAAAGLAGVPARLGLEPSAPDAAAALLRERAPRLALTDGSAALARARAIKTPWELERLRAAIRLADRAQRRLLELAPDAAGATDIELWSAITASVYAEAGRTVALTGVLVTGTATSTVTGGPTGRLIAAGDPGLLDISPRLDGYWADCANTVVFGAAPSASQRRYLGAARRACEDAIERLRPGARCAEPALALRASLAGDGIAMAHYAGHQLGTGVNEEPRLLPFADELIEPGMVFAVEAGAYGGSTDPVGARCEKVALVTGGDPELLSAFDWE